MKDQESLQVSGADTLNIQASARGAVGDGNGIPNNFELKQNHPNPYNPSTNIRFELPQTSDVQLTIYNTIGQEVSTLLNKKMTAGTHSLTFDASGLPSGVYIYQLKTEEFSRSRKMLLVK